MPDAQAPTRPEHPQVRKLKYQLKTAHKTMGAQGQTIHSLRAELSEVRELNSKLDRAELRRLQRRERELMATVETLREENQKLAIRYNDAASGLQRT